MRKMRKIIIVADGCKEEKEKKYAKFYPDWEVVEISELNKQEPALMWTEESKKVSLSLPEIGEEPIELKPYSVKELTVTFIPSATEDANAK